MKIGKKNNNHENNEYREIYNNIDENNNKNNYSRKENNNTVFRKKLPIRKLYSSLTNNINNKSNSIKKQLLSHNTNTNDSLINCEFGQRKHINKQLSVYNTNTYNSLINNNCWRRRHNNIKSNNIRKQSLSYNTNINNSLMNGESGQRKHINNKNNNFNKKQLEKYAKLILRQITLNIKLLKLLEYNSCNIDKEKCKLFIRLHTVYNNKKTLYNAFGIHLYNESKCSIKSNQKLLLTKSNQKLNSLTNNDVENGTVVDKLKNLIDDICTLSNIITNFFENLTNENLTKLQYLDPPMRQIKEPIDFTPDNIIETSSTNINKSNIAEENAIIEDNNTIANSSINNEIKHYLNKDINEKQENELPFKNGDITFSNLILQNNQNLSSELNHGNELSSKNGDITFSNLILQNNQNLSSELNHGNELLSKNGDITFSNLILQNNQNLSDELNQENEIVFVDKGNDFSMSSI